MSHSLRAKIKGLRYKGIITDKDCDRICKALDNEGVLDKIRKEIEVLPKTYPFVNHIDTYVKEDDVKKIIDKYIANNKHKPQTESEKKMSYSERTIENVVEIIRVMPYQFTLSETEKFTSLLNERLDEILEIKRNKWMSEIKDRQHLHTGDIAYVLFKRTPSNHTHLL